MEMGSCSELQRIIDDLPGMYFRGSGSPLRLTYASGGSVRLTGYTPSELVSGGGENFFALILHDNGERSDALKCLGTEAGPKHEATLRITDKSGATKWVLIRTHAIDAEADGRPSEFEGFACDVTMLMHGKVESRQQDRKGTPTQQKQNSGLTISGIDVEKGLAMTGGDQNTYFQVLKLFYENGVTFVNELKKTSADDVVRSYAVHAQTIKSVSASIGATDLTETSGKMAAAAENNDVEYIRTRSSEFLASLETLLSAIQKEIAGKNTSTKSGKEVKAVKKQSSVKRKILMIDDAHSFLLILNNILNDDYETMIAIDGEDGLETARLTKPDLILLDVVMPGLSGFDVLAELKSDKDLRDIPVILISGKDSHDNIHKGYELGATAYIAKPFERDEVLRKVGQVLELLE